MSRGTTWTRHWPARCASSSPRSRSQRGPARNRRTKPGGSRGRRFGRRASRDATDEGEIAGSPWGHWEPADLAALADHLATTYGDRFILGLGNSHALLLESQGRAYVKPYS